ncbi:MAG: DEAD/DEAH box helicase [Ignisphaera sp.]
MGRLISDGMLVELGKVDGATIYTTLHGDLVFRVLRGRAYEDDLNGRWVGGFNIDIEYEYAPDFGARSVSSDLKNVLARFFIDNGVKKDIAERFCEAIVEGLHRSGYQKLAEWQLKAIERILMASKERRYFVISAPTATGKTLVFQIVAIAHSLLFKYRGNQNRVLIVYPRRALQKQQLGRLVKPLYFINNKLKELGLQRYTVTLAVDSGVRYGLEPLLEGKYIDTGIPCPENDKLTIRALYKNNFAIRYECSDNKPLDFLVGIVYTKEDRDEVAFKKPDILISNPWTVEQRLLHPKSEYQQLYRGCGVVILDEAHVYINVNYVPLTAILRLLIQLRKIYDEEPLVITSSATIPLSDVEDLVRWMFGVSKQSVESLDYEELEPRHEEQRRLKIIVTLLPYRRSIETMLHGIIQLLLLIQMGRRLKSIVFIDSISETGTIMDYITTTFKYRRGVELCDHINQVSCRNHEYDKLTPRDALTRDNSDYSWVHLTDLSNMQYVKDLIEKLSTLINHVGLHHGGLNEEQRREIEKKFETGSLKTLIATSTLDLGMDYDDVAFIVQYKDPISDEALEQRVGRAGRKENTYRISLAFYIPTLTPVTIQRFFSRPQQKKDVALPDEVTLELVFLQRVLEYHIIQQLKSSILNGKIGEVRLDEAKNIMIQYIAESLNSQNILWLRRWGVRDELLKKLSQADFLKLMKMLKEQLEAVKPIETWKEFRKEIKKLLKEYGAAKKKPLKFLRESQEIKLILQRYGINLKDNKKEVIKCTKDVLKEIYNIVKDVEKDVTRFENSSASYVNISSIQSYLHSLIQELYNKLNKKRDLEGCKTMSMFPSKMPVTDIDRVNKIMVECVLPEIYNVELMRIRKRLEPFFNLLRNSIEKSPASLLMAISEFINFSGYDIEECNKIDAIKLSMCWYMVLRDEFFNIVSKIIPITFAWESIDTVGLRPL